MIQIEHVAKTFRDESGDLNVLQDVSFSLSKGEMVALAGVSGVGKTTLLQILGGLDSATAGTVSIDGKMLHELSPRELATFRTHFIGFVFQFHHLLPDFTALENTFMPGLIAGRRRQECTGRAKELLDAVGLSARVGHYPAELSGGERQRVALARALFNEPALVLADEPTGNLDRENGKLLLELFRKANEKFGQTFLVATHNIQLAEGMRRTLYLDQGRIVDQK